MQKLIGHVRAAIDRYNMIEKGDRIAVGVSGGKDSLFLLASLAELSKYYPNNFEVVAITADPCFGGVETDFSKVEKICEDLKVPYIIKRTNLGPIIFEERKEDSPCSLCARMRRGILHNLCIEHNCNKLALGHHHDDAVQTFMMNLLYGGKIGCFAPKTYLSRKDITAIRPLIFCKENDIKRAVAREKLPIVKSECPVDGITSRKDTAELLKTLGKDFSDINNKILGAMQRAGIDGW